MSEAWRQGKPVEPLEDEGPHPEWLGCGFVVGVIVGVALGMWAAFFLMIGN